MKIFKKNLSLFWTVYTGVCFGLVLLLVIGSIVLTSFLSAFEKSQPIHPAKEAFERYFEKGDFEEALKKAGFQTNKAENLSIVADALKEQAKGKKFTLCATGAEGGKATYNVVLAGGENSADTKIATLEMTKSEETSSFGFSPYEFSDIRFFFKGQESITCAVPESYTLFINGAVYEDENATTEEHQWNKYLPKNVDGITLKVYTLTGLFAKPTLSLKDEKGNEAEFLLDEESGRYEAVLTYEQVDSALKNRILTGMKEYAKYIQADGNLGTVATYFDKSSMFYKNTAGNPSSFVWDHNGYEFKKEVIEDFYFFDENTLCCHVSFDQVLKKTGREDYIDQLDMTIFAKKINGSWQIFDRIVR